MEAGAEVDASREAQGGPEPVRQGEADDPGPSSAAASVGSAALKKSIITFFGPPPKKKCCWRKLM